MNSWLSIYIAAPAAGWLVAHILKFLYNLIRSGGKDTRLSVFWRTGGMPSSHTAVMIATLTVIGGREGLGSAVFGLGFAVSAIVIYDALTLRRSVQQQGALLKELAGKSKNKLFATFGHTFTEVLAGAVVGVLVGWLLLQIL